MNDLRREREDWEAWQRLKALTEEQVEGGILSGVCG